MTDTVCTALPLACTSRGQCANLNLTDIPLGLSPSLTTLDLSGNRIFGVDTARLAALPLLAPSRLCVHPNVVGPARGFHVLDPPTSPPPVPHAQQHCQHARCDALLAWSVLQRHTGSVHALYADCGPHAVSCVPAVRDVVEFPHCPLPPRSLLVAGCHLVPPRASRLHQVELHRNAAPSVRR